MRVTIIEADGTEWEASAHAEGVRINGGDLNIRTGGIYGTDLEVSDAPESRED